VSEIWVHNTVVINIQVVLLYNRRENAVCVGLDLSFGRHISNGHHEEYKPSKRPSEKQVAFLIQGALSLPTQRLKLQQESRIMRKMGWL
jgi:hypothetical protein